MDVSRLTLGEVAKIEELSGMPISAIGDDDRPKGLALAAFAFVTKRREDPQFTWNAAQALTFQEVQDLLGLGQEDEEEEEAGPLDQDPTPSPRTPPKS